MSVASMTMGEFRVGEVLSRSMAILARNIVPFGLLAVLFTVPTFLATVIVDPQAGMMDPKTIQALEYGDESAVARFFMMLAAMIGLLLMGMVLSMLATAAMVYGTFQDLRGAPAAIGASLRHGLRIVFPVLGVALLSVLMMMLSAIALVIPMFIVMTMFWVAIPTAVVERPGVIASLKRSAELTKGNRWRVFGIYAVITLLSLVASSIVQVPFMASMVNAGPDVMMSGGFLAAQILGLLVTAFFMALSAVASAVAYHDLRAVNEGFDIDQFAAVFD